MKEEIEKALKILREGGILLYPTDTVWGLGCDATNPSAVAKIYEIKKRSDSKSLVLLASDMDMICRYVQEVPEMAIQLVEVNDKPMTIIYPGAVTGKYGLAENTVAEDGSVGIRIPMMDFCRQLVHRFGRPIVSTSANISGEPTPKKFTEITDAILKAADLVVDPALEAGATGLASQIIKVGLDYSIQIIRG
ncbi:MAG: threonylcarbamoyl-AMP synthase [Bacteroidales bacterium]|nr:threonylcarbamoyl-AMP synthase [Bacteroidales bacterium]